MRQRVSATLGCLDHLKASDHQQLDLIFLDTTLPAGRRYLPLPDQLQAVRMSLDAADYLIRTDFEGQAYQAFQAAGLRPPPRVKRLSANQTV